MSKHFIDIDFMTIVDDSWLSLDWASRPLHSYNVDGIVGDITRKKKSANSYSALSVSLKDFQITYNVKGNTSPWRSGIKKQWVYSFLRAVHYDEMDFDKFDHAKIFRL